MILGPQSISETETLRLHIQERGDKHVQNMKLTNLAPFPRELKENVRGPVCRASRGLYLFLTSYCGSKRNLKSQSGHTKCKSYHLSKKELTLYGGVLNRAV